MLLVAILFEDKEILCCTFFPSAWNENAAFTVGFFAGNDRRGAAKLVHAVVKAVAASAMVIAGYSCTLRCPVSHDVRGSEFSAGCSAQKIFLDWRRHRFLYA